MFNLLNSYFFILMKRASLWLNAWNYAILNTKRLIWCCTGGTLLMGIFASNFTVSRQLSNQDFFYLLSSVNSLGMHRPVSYRLWKRASLWLNARKYAILSTKRLICCCTEDTQLMGNFASNFTVSSQNITFFREIVLAVLAISHTIYYFV